MLLHVTKHLYQLLLLLVPTPDASDKRVVKELTGALTLSGVLPQAAVYKVSHVGTPRLQFGRLQVDDRLHGLGVFLPQERRLSLHKLNAHHSQ
jgi:hypothetical protein